MLFLVHLAGVVEPLELQYLFKDQKVDLLCASVGTGGALMGTLSGLNVSGLFPKTVALEPSESPLLTTGKGGPHKVEGIGVGFYPPFLDDQKVDDILAIDQDEAFEMRDILLPDLLQQNLVAHPQF